MESVCLRDLGSTYGGLTGKSKADFGQGSATFVTFREVIKSAHLREPVLEHVNVRPGERQNAIARGDILFNGSSEMPDELALSAVVDFNPSPSTYLNSFCFGYRLSDPRVEPAYVSYFFRSPAGRELIVTLAQGSTRYNIAKRKFLNIAIPVPDRHSQREIVSALADADSYIVALEAAVAKQANIRSGLAQQLLTGGTRLPGFDRPWAQMRIADLLMPRSERNALAEPLEVLSCSKHLGFVRSLDYFRNQVFSRDLSGYRVIHRGDIGYPANHIEEGSIGVQEIVDRGLVSPIYVVMQPREGVDSYFLQRQLKLDSFRQEFARATNASVDRRGSLRWRQFSQIVVWAPEPTEQQAISRVLRDAEAEVAALKRRLEKAKAIKQGMMQELLAGRRRLLVAGEIAA
jgi:type I restriction enzyme S subunit